MRRYPILRKNAYLVMPREPLPKHKDPQLSALDFVFLYLLGDDGMEDYHILCRGQSSRPYKALPKEEFLCYAKANSHSTTLDNIAMLNYFRRRRCPCPGPRRICAIGSGI